MKPGIFLIFLASCSIVSASTYYVAPSGDNSNSGTISQPWATFQYAVSIAKPSDTVFFRGGTYTLTSQILIQPPVYGHNGTASNPICYFNYPGEIPIFECSSIHTAYHSNNGLSLYGLSYCNFKGLTFRNVRQFDASDLAQGVSIYNTNVVKLENMTSHNIGGRGYRVSGSTDSLYFINCDAYNCADTLDPLIPGNGGVGFATSSPNSPVGPIFFSGCRAWHCSDDGFDGAYEGPIYYENCWAWGNGYLQGGGSGFKWGWVDTDPPVHIVMNNCLAAYNREYGLSENNDNFARTNMFVYNNTFYKNAIYGIRSWHWTSNAENENIYRNNISYDNTLGAAYVEVGYVHSYNSWDIPITITDADFISVDSTGLSEPRQADGSLPNLNFLKLASGSKLIDAGADVGISYYSSAPDLGYSEFMSSSVPSSPVYVSSSIENATPSRLDITYSLTLANIVPAASAFNVRVNSVSRTVSSVAVSGTMVQLTLSSPLVYGDELTVAYTKPSANPLQTPSGVQAASTTAQPVTNNVAAISPVYVSSVIENATPSMLEITFNLTLANIVPAPSAFIVRVNSSARTVNSVAISGTKAMLTLSNPVVYDDVITVTYTKPSTNPLQTPSGGQVASFSVQNVTNNCRLPANQPPISNISSPGKSSSFIAPATIVLDVNASDPDGTIIKVELFNYRIKLAEILTAPYSFTWKDVPAGTYSITAVATDNQNGISTSEPITIIVNNLTTTINQLPVVSITYPVNNSSFEVPQGIMLTADAIDPDGTISRVEYYNGDLKIGDSFSPPFTVPFEINKAGSYEITAIAFDNLNAVGSSSPINLYAILSSDNSDLINLYPNPNDGRFTINLIKSTLSGRNVVTITDMAGKTVYKKELLKEENINQFDLSDLHSDIYILMIYSNEIIITKKFIKK